MPDDDKNRWLSKLGVKFKSSSEGVKDFFHDLKEKFEPYKEPAEQIHELYDQIKEMKEKVEKVKETYDDLSELYAEASAAKEKCDQGDPDGIREARDLLAHALEKAQKLKLPPGGQELLEVYRGAVLATKVADNANYQAGSFGQYMANAETSGDTKAAVERAKEELCQGTPRILSERDFDKKLAEYVKAHPNGKVAAALKSSPAAEQASDGPAQAPTPPAPPSKEDVNARIAEDKVKPLKAKFEESLRELEAARSRAQRAIDDLKSAQTKSDAATAGEKQGGDAVDSASQAIERAKTRASQPRRGDEIVIGPSLKDAQLAHAVARAKLKGLQDQTATAKAAFEKAKAAALEAQNAVPKARTAAIAAEDAYQRERLSWYRRAQMATPSLAFPDDLKAWSERHPG
jgi:myosin heavy subunit